MDLLSQAQAGFATVDADPALKEQACFHLRRWLTEDEFAPYRPQIDWLIQTKQWAGLLDRFYQILPFGTGGRRGAVGIGPNRMNLWTLAASVQGHCEYLKERFPDVSPLHVVLAYDVRQFEDKRKNYNPDLPNPILHLSSKTFAHHAARIYVANGIHAHILPDASTRFLATPELSFFIRKLAAHGGLNISASHNPPDDNGGKFYDERGGQPVPPDDQIMADIVDQVEIIKTLPWSEVLRSGRIHFLEENLHKAYIELCQKQSLVKPPRFDEILVVFTPLHGVGSMTAMEVLVKQGFRVQPVEEQMKPDGQFPNVTQSPNPEVPVSMDKARALAEAIGADLVLATDPDADRLGALARESGEWRVESGEKEKAGTLSNQYSVLSTQESPTNNQHSALSTQHSALKFRYLNGNNLAALLTHFKLAKLTERGLMPRNPIVIKTLVTTGLVTRIARSFQAQIVENLLVGFKYIADVLGQLEQHGAYEDVQGTPDDFVLACEESHGLLVTPQIRDKDAAAPALLLAELALDQKRQGRTVLDYLDRIHRQFGFFCNDLRTIVMPGIEGKQNMARMLNLLRKSPPSTIAGLPLTGFEDLQNETGWMGPIKGATDRAARNFLIFRFGAHARIALRPSGTEPKAKAYVEVSSPPCASGTSSSDWERQCRETEQQTQQLADAFMEMAQGLVK